MELALLVYGILHLLPAAVQFFGWVGVILLLIALVYYIESIHNRTNDDTEIALLKTSKKFFWIGAAMCTIAIIIPGKKTTYLMVGAYIGQNVVTSVANSETYDKASKVLSKKINEELDKMLEDKQDGKK